MNRLISNVPITFAYQVKTIRLVLKLPKISDIYTQYVCLCQDDGDAITTTTVATTRMKWIARWEIVQNLNLDAETENVFVDCTDAMENITVKISATKLVNSIALCPSFKKKNFFWLKFFLSFFNYLLFFLIFQLNCNATCLPGEPCYKSIGCNSSDPNCKEDATCVGSNCTVSCLPNQFSCKNKQCIEVTYKFLF